MAEDIFLLIRDYFKKTDKLLWILTLIASLTGCCLIASQQRFDTVDFLKTQIIAVILGVFCALIISVADYSIIAGFWYITGAVGLVLTILVFFIGIQINGTDDTGWIRLPWGTTFQPSEITKICFILTLSKHLAYLSEKDKLHSFWGVLTLLIHGAVPVVMIHFQGDDGAALVFALMFMIMTFAAGVQIRYFIIALVSVAAALPFIWTAVLNIEQKNRLTALWTSDDSMFRTYGWQQYQGKVSIASGGIFGKGLFNGPRVARDIVPYQENDFIFTVAGEELGFIGCAAILVLFLIMLLRLLRNSAFSEDFLGKNIYMGFFALIGVHVLVNIGMVLGILPVIGITLPFFSSGGSSAVCLYLGVGLVQSVYMHPKTRKSYSLKPKSAKNNRIFV